MHDSMPYDPIQGQGQGHGLLKFQKSHFQGLSPLFTTGAGK